MEGYCSCYFEDCDIDDVGVNCEDYLDCEDCPYWEESVEE